MAVLVMCSTRKCCGLAMPLCVTTAYVAQLALCALNTWCVCVCVCVCGNGQTREQIYMINKQSVLAT